MTNQWRTYKIGIFCIILMTALPSLGGVKDLYQKGQDFYNSYNKSNSNSDSQNISKSIFTSHKSNVGKNCKMWFAVNRAYKKNAKTLPMTTIEKDIFRKVLLNCEKIIRLTDQLTTQTIEHDGMETSILGSTTQKSSTRFKNLAAAFQHERKRGGTPPVRSSDLSHLRIVWERDDRSRRSSDRDTRYSDRGRGRDSYDRDRHDRDSDRDRRDRDSDLSSRRFEF